MLCVSLCVLVSQRNCSSIVRMFCVVVASTLPVSWNVFVDNLITSNLSCLCVLLDVQHACVIMRVCYVWAALTVSILRVCVSPHAMYMYMYMSVHVPPTYTNHKLFARACCWLTSIKHIHVGLWYNYFLTKHNMTVVAISFSNKFNKSGTLQWVVKN